MNMSKAIIIVMVGILIGSTGGTLLRNGESNPILVVHPDNPELIVEVTEPPEGWYIQRGKNTKEFRWCDVDNFCSPFSEDTKIKATRMAWKQYDYRNKKESREWETIE